MNVFGLDGRPILVNPDFRDLTGEFEYPLWLVREVKEQLAAKEPYTIIAGVGTLLRYSPWLVNTGKVITNFEATPWKRVPAWAATVARHYRHDVLGSLQYELDSIEEMVEDVAKLHTRKGAAMRASIRSLKLRRDDAESVLVIASCWKDVPQYEVQHAHLNRIDTMAVALKHVLSDPSDAGLERRLNVVYQKTSCWWGVKDTV